MAMVKFDLPGMRSSKVSNLTYKTAEEWGWGPCDPCSIWYRGGHLATFSTKNGSKELSKTPFSKVKSKQLRGLFSFENFTQTNFYDEEKSSTYIDRVTHKKF